MKQDLVSKHKYLESFAKYFDSSSTSKDFEVQHLEYTSKPQATAVDVNNDRRCLSRAWYYRPKVRRGGSPTLTTDLTDVC